MPAPPLKSVQHTVKNVISDNLTILLFGPTGCLSGDTKLSIQHGDHSRKFTLRELYHKFIGQSLKGRKWDTSLATKINSYKDNILLARRIAAVTYSGIRPTFIVETESGKSVRATADHRFLTSDGYVQLENLSVGDSLVIQTDKKPSAGRTVRHNRQTVKARFHPRSQQKVINSTKYFELYLAWAVIDAHNNNLSLEGFLYIVNNDEVAASKLQYVDETLVVHHKNENPSDNRIQNLQIMTKLEHDTYHGKKNYVNWGKFYTATDKIVNIVPYGEEETYDITMEDDGAPNFVANGIVVHNSGKTALIGELAEWYFANYNHKRTRLYTADRGGWETIRPYVELGIVEVVPMFGEPWNWLDHAVKGDKLIDGKWVPGLDSDIALYAFEGYTSIADAQMSWMAEASTRGVNIGGGGSFSFNVQGDGDKPTKIGSNNMAHYSVAQQQAFEKSTQSQSLPGTVLWTAGDRRGEDDANGGVVGPQVAGKALTGEVPRWFKYTFRVAVEVLPGMPAKHVLYTDKHVELASKGMAQGISNARIPLSGGDPTKGGIEIPSKIEPASLVRVFELLNKRQASAKDEIAKRLGISK